MKQYLMTEEEILNIIKLSRYNNGYIVDFLKSKQLVEIIAEGGVSLKYFSKTIFAFIGEKKVNNLFNDIVGQKGKLIWINENKEE